MIKPLANKDIVEFIPDENGMREHEGEFFVVTVEDGVAFLIGPEKSCFGGPAVPVEQLRRVEETFGEFTREPFVDEESVTGGDTAYEYYD